MSSNDILKDAFNATVSRNYEKAVAVIRNAVAKTSHSFSVDQLELIDHVYACILNTSHYDESLIAVCWEWIEAIERQPRTVDSRAVSSSQLSIYYAYHTICRVQERMPKRSNYTQVRTETWIKITHSFSYLWAAATQLWKPYELDRLDILCSWSYLCLQFADVFNEEVLNVIEASKDNAKSILNTSVIIENSHQANQRVLTIERNLRDSRAMAEKMGRKLSKNENAENKDNVGEHEHSDHDDDDDEAPEAKKSRTDDNAAADI
ncbi:unnamed protein product [Caenorhabditis bovis]|uniref:Uncharacterized protein n=1 Tax=Caenorhabditis bovis TaxID=2654633 RepID=A0A8S1F9X0_9PELO|nr:unnamed protein product [Caenorhabditis bovis]